MQIWLFHLLHWFHTLSMVSGNLLQVLKLDWRAYQYIQWVWKQESLSGFSNYAWKVIYKFVINALSFWVKESLQKFCALMPSFQYNFQHNADLLF